MLLRTTVRVYLAGHWFPPGTLIDVYGDDSELVRVMIQDAVAVPVTDDHDHEHR